MSERPVFDKLVRDREKNDSQRLGNVIRYQDVEWKDIESDYDNIPPILSVTSNGVKFSEDRHNFNQASDDLSSYKVVRRGQFAYNRMDIETGSLVLQDLVEIGLISPDYRVFEAEGVDPYYLYQILSCPAMLTIYDSLQSGVRQRLRRNKFNQISVPIPPIKEQRQLASIIHISNEISENISEILGRLEPLREHLLHELVTEGINNNNEFKEVRLGPTQTRVPNHWDTLTFGDISEVQQGLQIAKSDRHKDPGDGRYEYITVQHLNEPDNEKHEWYIENPRDSVKCNKNDILLTRTGNTGEVITDVSGVFHNNIFRVDFDRDRLQKDFLVYYLESPLVQNLMQTYAGSTTISDLNHGDFFNIPVVIPPFSEQEAIADHVKNIDDKINHYREYKSQIEETSRGVLKGYISGDLEVPDHIEVSDTIGDSELPTTHV